MESRFFIVYLFPSNVCFSCVVGSQGPSDINLTKRNSDVLVIFDGSFQLIVPLTKCDCGDKFSRRLHFKSPS